MAQDEAYGRVVVGDQCTNRARFVRVAEILLGLTHSSSMVTVSAHAATAAKSWILPAMCPPVRTSGTPLCLVRYAASDGSGSRGPTGNVTLKVIPRTRCSSGLAGRV